MPVESEAVWLVFLMQRSIPLRGGVPALGACCVQIRDWRGHTEWEGELALSPHALRDGRSQSGVGSRHRGVG